MSIDNNKENEYRELFLAEAMDNFEEINRLLTLLEKDQKNSKHIQALFRITHTLKGNAAGLGFEEIAELGHVIEDIFGEIKDKKIEMSDEVFTSIFKAVDILGSLIGAIKNPKKVNYKGIKTKLEVLVRNSREQSPNNQNQNDIPTGIELETISMEDTNQFEPEEIDEITKEENTQLSFSDLVQVPVSKLDNLLNLVGELIIERDRLIVFNSNHISANEFSRLNRISSDLQYSVMDVRLVQVGFLFNKFHRIVRDVASKEGKIVDLKLEGNETEIDRNVLQVISDSLIHLIRNGISHGIESPEKRKTSGKSEKGIIELSASSESDNVLLTIKDDGAGIDPNIIKEKALSKGIVSAKELEHMKNEDILMLIFQAGFSTMNTITDISGRGVGMDVVKKALDAIGGNIRMESVIGAGTTFTLNLPSSMAVKSTLLFELDQQVYAIPLNYTESVISIKKKDIKKAFNGLVTVNQGNTIVLVHLSELMSNSIAHTPKSIGMYSDDDKLDVVIVKFNEKRLGFIVDRLLQQKEIIEKPLKKPVDANKYLSGVTIMGNGHVCLVLSVPGIAQAYFNKINKSKISLEHA